MAPGSSVVVCPEPLAARAGQHILACGGNAVDAALAAAFAQGVVNPFLCGLGGMGLFYYYRACDGLRTVLDAGVTIGSRPVPESWPGEAVGRDETIGRYLLRSEENQVGYLSVMVPGFVRGCGEAFRRFGSGRLGWAELLAPAIELAREGFVVDAYLAAHWREIDSRPGHPSIAAKLAATAEAGRTFWKAGGRGYEAGDRLVQRDLAATLERLAHSGAEDFYTGEIGAQIGHDFEQHQGSFRPEDLAGYTVRVARPCRGTYRGLEVTGAGAPASAAHVIEILQILEHFPLRGLDTVAELDLLARVQRASFADNVRLKCLNPEKAAEIEAEIVSAERAAYWARRIRAGDRVRVRSGTLDPGTTHVVCVDGEGNIVTFTHSIGSLAGSGVISPGLGFLYNNFLGHFNPRPGCYDSIEPGKRFNGGAPLILFDKDGRPVLAAGAPGGSRIVTALAQCIVNVVERGMGLEAAVAAPRIHSEEGVILFLEPAFGDEVAEALRVLGNDVRVSRAMARVQMVSLLAGSLEAASDPRGGGGIGWWPVR